MTLTTATGQRQFTEADLLALTLRFHIRSEHGIRAFYVDGVEVSEAEYLRAFQESTGLAIPA
jgi:protein-disulfide isomerase-like protein with CxxC motif